MEALAGFSGAAFDCLAGEADGFLGLATTGALALDWLRLALLLGSAAFLGEGLGAAVCLIETDFLGDSALT